MQMQMSIHIDIISLSVCSRVSTVNEKCKWVYSGCDELKLFLNVSQLLKRGVLSVLELTTQARHESIRGVFARQFLNLEPCDIVAIHL